MCPASSANILPEPPEELKSVSAELAQRIRERIDRDGPLPFSEYMEMALYEPGLGYYSAGLQKFGAEGDFLSAGKKLLDTRHPAFKAVTASNRISKR